MQVGFLNFNNILNNIDNNDDDFIFIDHLLYTIYWSISALLTLCYFILTHLSKVKTLIF